MSLHFTRGELIRSKTAQDRKIINTPPLHIIGNLDFTAAGLERIRAVLGHHMTILSGYRCQALNTAVGGARNSQHMAGLAADFICQDFGDPDKIVSHLKSMVKILGIDQMILESSWVHVSFTLDPRYQVLRKLADNTYEQA